MAGSKLDVSGPHGEAESPSARTPDETRPGQSPLFLQVFSWLRTERAKLAARKLKESDRPSSERSDSTNVDSWAGEMELSLDQLERILAQYSNIRSKSAMAQKQRIKGLRRGSHSDSDYADSDQAVPSADVVLDNSKTLLYVGGEADSNVDALAPKPFPKDRENWLKFKSEIVRLAHTLGIKGWRRVPLESGGEVEVIRLSGALTNAVYVISPPKNLPLASRSDSSLNSTRRKPPPKLLLRVYGPQAEHLIDRERELQILRRLRKKNIGPRVLGTFANGRFEQYFNAKPLTCHELRIPETWKQIAKRMRELHDGIDLLPEERESGPALWQNWDKWVDRCEKVTTWLDQEILSEKKASNVPEERWRQRGFVCCVPWRTFRATVDRYRKWLSEHFGGDFELSKRLVFAHNDTQYGNLLRLQPSEESPLLLPANEHKQLIVIDFEYASANMRGVEFANHFTPLIRPAYASSPRAPPFLLDSYIPGLNPPLTDPESRDPVVEAEVQQLLRETRLWRVANSAQWVAWGIVQAHVPGINKVLSGQGSATNATDTTTANPISGKTAASVEQRTPINLALNHDQVKQEFEAEEAADDFDYLAYAQDRALFFWSDLLALGFIKEEELPAEMVKQIKKRIINY
ncbi:predicted protein [Uncinocarpus reesii 1704]|uniref:Choline kinase N-terminal domain-containing protein n=1 Tax=Uncinocarpus reesii (strain UAMH 1704) TaxID=336963 RepID=C4JIM0_UNCRE|nr:uncharacterized protein UREG_02881 [Uncinocarpus reesii 1704]EEP78032.1 predicted protein [Uncinocarpus reesii 1704]